MSCFSCLSPRRSVVRRIDIENGKRSSSRHSADSSGIYASVCTPKKARFSCLGLIGFVLI
jgi:hypothetical protein